MKIGVKIVYSNSLKLFGEWIDFTENSDNSNWECSNKIVEYSKNKHKPCSLEIFLILSSPWLEGETLEEYLKVIKQKTWFSARIYLVIDRRVGTLPQYVVNEAILNPWFEIIDNSGIDDILQINLESSYDDLLDIPVDKLIELAKYSRQRNVIWNKLKNKYIGWEYYIPLSCGLLEDFLCNFLRKDNNDASNLMVITDGFWLNCKNQVNHKLRESQKIKIIFAVSSINPNPDLLQYARDLNADVLLFSGFCDLHYFLQRLSPQFTVPVSADIMSVNSTFDELEESVCHNNLNIFKKEIVPSNKLQCLTTSSFDPSDFHPYNYLLNSQTSQAIHNLFGKQIYPLYVLPSATLKNLDEYLSSIPQDLLIWTHFGHGNEKGLQEFGGLYQATNEWLRSFKGKRKWIGLSFFFSCNSRDVAKKFVKAGVKTAIGFNSKVSMQFCLSLAEVVIPAAITTNADQREILTAFRQKCENMESLTKKYKPQIFLSE